MGLTLDPQLIRDLTVLITSSTLGGMLLEAVRQPVINGYFIAGSLVGPGGLKLIKVCLPCLSPHCFHVFASTPSCLTFGVVVDASAFYEGVRHTSQTHGA